MSSGCVYPLSTTEAPGVQDSASLKEDTVFHDEYTVRIVGMAVILILGVPLNTLVIYTFLGGNAQHTRVNYLVGHLCAINLVHALFSIPFDIIWHITGSLFLYFLYLTRSTKSCTFLPVLCRKKTMKHC